MKKRVLGLILMLAMALTFLPTTAEAANYLDFGDGWWGIEQEDLDIGTPPALELNNGYLADGKKYYLVEDVTIYKTMRVEGTVTLDLNGHVLKLAGSGSVFKMSSGANFTIQDSEPNTVHKFDKNTETGLLTLNEASGTEIIRGGIITGGNTIQGAGITMDEGAVALTMTGGTIVGCQSTNAAGGILAWGRDVVPTITLSGTSRITGCTAPTPYGSAIGVALEANLNLYGGLVEGEVHTSGTIRAGAGQPTVIYGNVYTSWKIVVENTLYVYGKIEPADCSYDSFSSVNSVITYKNDGDIYLSMCYSIGGTVTPPTEPEKNGILFAGWFQEDGTAYDFSTPAKGGITTLTAKWFDPATAGGKGDKGDTGATGA